MKPAEKDYKDEFRAFLEGLEMENIPSLMEQDCDFLRELGSFMAREFRRMKGGFASDIFLAAFPPKNET